MNLTYSGPGSIPVSPCGCTPSRMGSSSRVAWISWQTPQTVAGSPPCTRDPAYSPGLAEASAVAGCTALPYSDARTDAHAASTRRQRRTTWPLGSPSPPTRSECNGRCYDRGAGARTRDHEPVRPGPSRPRSGGASSSAAAVTPSRFERRAASKQTTAGFKPAVLVFCATRPESSSASASPFVKSSLDRNPSGTFLPPIRLSDAIANRP